MTDERIDRFKRTSAFMDLAISRKRKDKKKSKPVKLKKAYTEEEVKAAVND